MKLKKSIALSENGFIFNAALGDSFTTNPIGSYILQLIKDGKKETEIKTALLERYEVDAATCEKDLYDFIKVLKSNNLLDA